MSDSTGENGGWDAVSVSDYGLFPKMIKDVRQSLLNAPSRFQSISERQDRSDIGVETIKAHTKGKYFIHHRGCVVLKTADDLTIFKELLTHVRPATVIELGTFTGGSAMWMADTMKLEGITCSLYSMDINTSVLDEKVKEMKGDNVKFLQGDSNKIAETLTKDFLKDLPHPWVVIEDSHVNVYKVLEYFLGFMETGDYFVVEDANPLIPSHMGEGRIHHNYVPVGTEVLDVLKKFLGEHKKECKVDSYFTDFFGYNGTWNWHGFIRRM